MERIKNQFYEKEYVIDAEDPYNTALEFINFMASFGEINVTKNIMSSTGPRKDAEVHFYLERKFDRYSKLFFLFKLHANITMKNLKIIGLGMNQLQIPVGGQAGEVFQEWYMKEVQPDIHKRSTKIINEITKTVERYLSEITEDVNTNSGK